MSELTRLVGGRIVPIAGTWAVDAGHTSAAFGVRHLLTIMRGRFTELSGTIVIAEDPLESTVEVTIAAASINTANEGADKTLRGDAFLNVEEHPDMTFKSTAIAAAEDGNWTVTGDLTIRGITQSVELATEFVGAVTSPLGDLQKMSFVAQGSISREMYEMSMTMESPDTPGVYIIGNRIDLTLDIEADLQS